MSFSHSRFCAMLLAASACLPSVAEEQRPDPKGLKPYDDVITKQARSDPGIFIVHRLDNTLFYEIPPTALGKDMLWVTQLESTQAGFSYAGMPIQDRVVRWELRDDVVLLRDVNYAIRADVKDPIRLAVEGSSLAPIIRSFPIKAWGKDRAPVIEVTALFVTDVNEFSARRQLGAAGMDGGRTFLEEVKSFVENIETRVLATYGLGGGPSRDPSQSAVTVVLHHSMVKLPDQPMKPRRSDERIGYFTVDFEDYGDLANHQVDRVAYITRWRLEKKDPAAAVSEAKKPIVFYVGREVPEKWKPWVKKGIEAWQPAFEAAGFKDAILAKLAPSPHEDPDWDAEDARISSIRWLPSETENAFGPHVHDPRTGEILEADVRLFHNVLKLVRDWYFVQASVCDPRARSLPMPDDLVGELLAFVVTHEVGHSLGFRHNMKASASYTVAQLRDPEFTKKYGTTASIMDYARFNYVAQPGDGAVLMPVVGPYDFFSVEWGYREFAAGDNEKAKLEEIAKRQIQDPKLRFGDPNPFEDPSQQTEDLGSDAVAATEMGVANLKRIASFLVTAACKPGEDYSLLANMYEKLLGQWSREMMHVVNVVGGVERLGFRYGDGDRVYHPVAADYQRRAVDFLVRNAFRVPAELVDPSITLRLQASGSADRMLREGEQVLRSLLAEPRLKRMQEAAARLPAGTAYSVKDLFGDLGRGLWLGLDGRPEVPDFHLRNLQRVHVALLRGVADAGRADSDSGALARRELKEVLGRLDALESLPYDPVLRAHAEDLRIRIRQALDPAAPNREAAPAEARF